MKNGLINSDGCNEKPKIYIHLFAPLFIGAKNKTSIIKIIQSINPYDDIFIIFLSSNIDVKITIKTPEVEKIKFL